MQKTRTVLVGTGGFGAGYVKELLMGAAKEKTVLAGAVDPYAAQGPMYPLLKECRIPIYDTVEEFYQKNAAALAVIATPIQFHEPQAVYCLRAGSHVLLEKPLAATMEKSQSIIRARDESGKKLAVGFQWSYDAAMLRVKADVAAGLYGAPRLLKSLVLWPRDRAYYSRGLGWAGKRYDKSGEPIFDNVASNATAHYLFNMLWLPGAGFVGQGFRSMEALCYRANEIETFDTIVLQGINEGGARLWFGASHAAGKAHYQDPVFEYRFEDACLRFGAVNEIGSRITAWKDGRMVKDYGPSSLNDLTKLHTMLDSIHKDTEIPVPAEAALNHVKAMEQVRTLCPEAPFFPDNRILEAEGLKTVDGLGETMTRLYQSAAFPTAL